MLMAVRPLQKGDTLIEVLFAVTVFSLVAVSGLSIMNQGSAAAQRSLEITLVRQQIDAQAEALRLIHDSYIAAYPNVVSGEPSSVWAGLITKSDGVLQASTFGTTCTPPSNAFILNPKTAQLVAGLPGTPTSTVPTYSQLRYSVANPLAVTAAEGIWVEAVRSTFVAGATTRFIDFHIRACWEGPGQTPITLGTIVRLYEPQTP